MKFETRELAGRNGWNLNEAKECAYDEVATVRLCEVVRNTDPARFSPAHLAHYLTTHAYATDHALVK